MYHITVSRRSVLTAVAAMALVVPGVAGASHIFSDVEDGSTHAAGIEWVADRGVSTGCGDGSTYCPGDDVSRAQMGTFLCRLAGHCGVAPSVDADAVDGLDAADLQTRVAFDADDWAASPAEILSTEVVKLAEVALTATVDGVLHVEGHLSASVPLDVMMMLWIQIDDPSCVGDTDTGDANNATGALAYQSVDGGEFETIHVSTAESVGSGTHTATLCTVSTGNGTGWANSLVATFTPGS